MLHELYWKKYINHKNTNDKDDENQNNDNNNDTNNNNNITNDTEEDNNAIEKQSQIPIKQEMITQKLKAH